MKNYQIFNAGFPGDTTVELLKRFHRDVAVRNPELVCLLVGSNDMFYPGHILELAVYRKNLLALLDRIQVIGADCILFTAPRFVEELLIENFPETLNHPVSIADRLKLLNDVIRDVAVERDVVLIDLNKLIDPVDESIASLVLNPANSNRRDGMHLTADGLKIMAEATGEKIRKYFPDVRTIVCFGDSITYGVYMPGKGTAGIDALTYPGQLLKLLNG